MRLFLSCHQGRTDYPVPAYAFWLPYFRNGAREAGMSVVEAPGIDWAEGLVPDDERAARAWRERTWPRVVEIIAREHRAHPIDFFLSYLYPKQVDETAIADIRRLGIPAVNFFCDNFREYREVPPVYRCFDLHWVPEFEALGMYKASGMPYVHAPMPAWIAPELRAWNHPETHPPTFIGSADELRRSLFAEALSSGADFVIRGRGWADAGDHEDSEASFDGWRTAANQIRFVQEHGGAAWIRKSARRLRATAVTTIPARHVGPSLSGVEYIEHTQGAVVTLGVNRVPTFRAPSSRPLRYSRLRDIEAPMLGACYLTEWTEGLSHLYELGDEIESYRTAEEMRDKLSWLVAHPAHRQELRRKGQRRALDDHSVARTLDRIVSALHLTAS